MEAWYYSKKNKLKYLGSTVSNSNRHDEELDIRTSDISMLLTD